MKLTDPTVENIAYHAARLLLLIAYCGKPRSTRSATLPAIEGRTLLAKLDFFLRYPNYLMKAADILQKEVSGEDIGIKGESGAMSVESRMVRYRYGPWDHIYYPALAYLVGKQLIVIEPMRGTDIFRLTPQGRDVSDLLSKETAYLDLVRRAVTIYRLFNKYSGNRLKDFIYDNFPEVVGRKLGETI
ncbi:MAG: hypothetical protein L0226_08955 [Acidobacteria bacterium]|nr:hypothetical protein [Acidobacteriota bacterium]